MSQELDMTGARCWY